MKSDDAWTNFWRTGSVENYLNYVAECKLDTRESSYEAEHKGDSDKSKPLWRK